MKRILAFTTALTLTGTVAAFAADGRDTGYALTNDGGTLLVMSDIMTPSEAQSFALSETITALAWRPVTGDLLGFAPDAIYTINTETGELSNLDAQFMEDTQISTDANVAFDFNNQIDAVRAVSSDGVNLVYFPNDFGDGDEKAGSVRRFTDVFYPDEDENAGETPLIFANAYTNAINGETASSTFQYALDANTDALVSLANNEGTLKTIAKITIDGEEIDIAPMGGFDIVSASEGDDKAYAILQIEGQDSAGLYTIDLNSGAASLQSDLGDAGFTSLAVSMSK